MMCSLCGYGFITEKNQATCNGCPLKSNCSFIRCPNCGYEQPGEAKVFKAIKKIKLQFASVINRNNKEI